MTYQDFLETKVVSQKDSGFEVAESDIHPALFPHQRDIVRWAVKGGRRAIFASFGLGKSLMQLEIMRQIHDREGGLCLIICPLGVKQEFQRDGKIIGMDHIEYVRTTDEALAAQTPFLITNYERVRDGGIDPNIFTCVCLDEASVLRGYGTKTYQTFLSIFPDVKYKFVATATPSPNKYKELIHYAGFLGVMDTGQALTRFFQRDSTQANNLTIYPHKEREFWLWMSTWSVFIQKPSDLGYSDDGYDLPDLKVIYHRLTVDHQSAGVDGWGNVKMFRDAAVSLSDAAKEKRDSLPDRMAKMREIVDEAGADRHWLIWHNLEAERYAIERSLPEVSTVFGSQDLEEREDLIIGFSEGKYRILATKPEIAGSGCNFQRFCYSNIFLGVNYQFNDFIQAIHRTHRFQQPNQVEVHIIHTESEDNIISALKAKWERHTALQEKMGELIREYGLSRNIEKELHRSIGVSRQEFKGKLFTCVHNDCVDELSRMADNSVDLIHSSIPFGTQYEYAESYNDFGHNDDNDGFFEQMDFLIPDLLRVLKPGRVAAIHVKDRIRFGNVTGMAMPTVDPFSDDTIRAFRRHGFAFFGRITVVTDVVAENNQTYRLGWTENSKDGTKMGVGMPEYVLLFRKLPTDLSNAYADEPVTKDKKSYTRAQWQIDAHAFWRSRGDRFYTPEELAGMDMEMIIQSYRSFGITCQYSYEDHVAMGKELESLGRLPATFMLFAPPSTSDAVWTDVSRMHTLNGEQVRKSRMNHVCPLQFDIVDRIIHRFSNPGDLVLDPFGGLMTVPYRAILADRRGYGVELNEEYWRDGVGYCKAAEYKKTIPTLFD